MRLRLTLLALLLAAADLHAQKSPSSSSVVNGRSKDGEELSADLPGPQHMKNIGSKRDGAGMCVFTSIEIAVRWHGIESFRGFRDWCANNYPGGGYPQKVDQLIAAYCKAKNIQVPPYIQYEGTTVQPILDLCDRTGRMACITYGYSPRYGNATIAHMTCCPKFSGKWSVCLDNNFPGIDSYEWMSPDEMQKRIKWPQNSGWIFAWLARGASARSPLRS